MPKLQFSAKPCLHRRKLSKKQQEKGVRRLKYLIKQNAFKKIELEMGAYTCSCGQEIVTISEKKLRK